MLKLSIALLMLIYSLPVTAAEQPKKMEEIHGDVHIKDMVEWKDAHYKIYGNLFIESGGVLILNDVTVELMNNYSREFNYRWSGGTLISNNSVIGGTKRDGTIYQSNIELYEGEWYCTDTTVQYCYGITFGYATGGKLRALRLKMGESPDSVIIEGKGDVVVKDSEYCFSLTTSSAAGGKGDFDLPVDQPVNRVFDSTNMPGAGYRLELVNTKVPYWFLFTQVFPEGPPTEMILRNCPKLIPSITVGNIKGKVYLPCRGGVETDEEAAKLPLLSPNTAIDIGNVTFKTLDKPAFIYTWGAYFWGDKTDVTLVGPTLICELMLWAGKCSLIGQEGTFNAKTAATTIEVGSQKAMGEHQTTKAELVIKNATIGRMDVNDPVTGQITAHRDGSVYIENARTGKLHLITKDNGTITMKNIKQDGRLTKIPDGGPIVVSDKE